MPKRVKMVLRIATSVMVFSGYLALASVDIYGILLTIPGIFIVFFSPIGERLDVKYPAYKSFMRTLQIAYACFIPLSYLALGLLLGVISLVIFIQVMLMIRIRNEREDYYVFMMSFFLLLAACVSAPEPMIAVAIFLFLMSSIWCFILIRFKAELEGCATHQPEVESLNDPAPRLEGTKNLFDAGLVGTLVGISFVSLIITAGLFLVIPRVEAGFLGSSELPVATTGAGSDTVDVASGISIALEDQSAVMYVKFPELEGGQYPAPQQMYWRLFSLPRYGDASWSRGELNAHLESGLAKMPFEAQFINPLMANRDKKHREIPLVAQEIYLDRIPEDGLPALHFVQKISLDRSAQGSARVSWNMDALDFSMILQKRGAQSVNYIAWSEPPRHRPEDLRKVEADYSFVSEQDMRMLTYHDLLPGTQEDVATLIADAETLYDKVKTVESYLSGPTFTYTLIVQALPSENPVDTFLNEMRSGHCERFATAMALMLRSQGIPARVVTGYRGGDWDPSGASYIIRNSMAHLWVEVLFPGVGWVIFDPSPRADETDMALVARLSRTFANYELRAKIFWYQNVIQFDRSLQISSLRDFGISVFTPFQQMVESTRDISSFSRNWAGTATLYSVLIALIFLVFWSWKSRGKTTRHPLSTDQKRAALLYQRLRGRLQNLGLDCRMKTAEEIMQDAAGARWTDAGIFGDTLRVYNETRFGLRPIQGSEYGELQIRIKRLRRAD